MLSPEAVVSMLDLRDYVEDDRKRTEEESVKDEESSGIITEEEKDEHAINDVVEVAHATIVDNKTSTKADTIVTSNSAM
jgi:hypothetical protein